MTVQRDPLGQHLLRYEGGENAVAEDQAAATTDQARAWKTRAKRSRTRRGRRSREARQEMINPGDRLRCLVDKLTASGELTDGWRAAFLSVPRHMFIPETIWRDNGTALVPLRRADDPSPPLKSTPSWQATRGERCMPLATT